MEEPNQDSQAEREKIELLLAKAAVAVTLGNGGQLDDALRLAYKLQQAMPLQGNSPTGTRAQLQNAFAG